ncbi:hypothetical protein JCM24511_06333 [Saitozyma sp. JCM 24511]|nr:hypothetical protein JCM24511_06333 [Saitozyma sp. JCM 24511]
MLRRWSSLALLALAVVVSADRGGDDDTVVNMVERIIPLRTHTIVPPYVDTDLQNRWWDFGADAVINTNKHIRLTQDRPSQTGWLWSRMPLSVPNWQIDVEFKVDGKAHNLFGDGFALWIAKDRAKVGPVFGSVDYFNGLGIFFDTYANSRHSYQWPRVTAMLGDGKTSYDHDHDNAANEIAGCSENFRRRDIPTKARLSYIKGKVLQLKLQTKMENEWTTCFELPLDLPDHPFIGFSALTGDVSDDHDIVSVNTASLTLRPEFRDDPKQKPMAASGAASGVANPKPIKGKMKGREPKKSGGAAGWFLFILKAIGVMAFIAFSVAAYKKSKRAW